MILISLIAAAIAAPAAVFPTQPLARDPKCPTNPAVFHTAGPAVPNPRRLDREPPASLYLSVYREVAGCATPIVLSTRR